MIRQSVFRWKSPQRHRGKAAADSRAKAPLQCTTGPDIRLSKSVAAGAETPITVAWIIQNRAQTLRSTLRDRFWTALCRRLERSCSMPSVVHSVNRRSETARSAPHAKTITLF